MLWRYASKNMVLKEGLPSFQQYGYARHNYHQTNEKYTYEAWNLSL